jgi:ankyrin repeat protein
MFSELANELCLSIAENLRSERDINAFARTDCRLYRLLNEHLYRHNVRYRESSALLWGSKHRQEGTVRKTLKAGADVDVSDNEDRTPLFIAAGKGHDEMVELLLSEGANIDAQNGHSGNALYVASANCHSQVVKVLLGGGR